MELQRTGFWNFLKEFWFGRNAVINTENPTPVVRDLIGLRPHCRGAQKNRKQTQSPLSQQTYPTSFCVYGYLGQIWGFYLPLGAKCNGQSSKKKKPEQTVRFTLFLGGFEKFGGPKMVSGLKTRKWSCLKALLLQPINDPSQLGYYGCWWHTQPPKIHSNESDRNVT